MVLRLIKEPLLQFLVIGALIYGAYALFGAAENNDADYTIVVDESRINGFITGWQSRMSRPPTPGELDGMIDQYLKEEILYREARAMGLGEDDPITRRRLAQKLEFLTKDIARLKEPLEGELEAYFEANKQSYRGPDLITFTHVFVDPDKRDAATLGDAEILLAQLKAAGEPNEQTRELGDRFMLQSYYPQKSELDIRRQFGVGFSEPVMLLEPGQWHGPVLSGYGVHLVYVHALQRAPEPAFADVEAGVFEDWQAEQQEKFNAEYFASLRSRYEIIVDVEDEQSGRNDGAVSTAPAAAGDLEEPIS
ncbi:MAG: peptidylprolyl isomerase [Gammaproteobacteria bacterium]|nr:peptidylprolyl isomerase [Gammaproteobacteria bacterium]